MQSSIIKLAISLLCISYILGYCTEINPSNNALDCISQYNKTSFCCNERITFEDRVINRCVIQDKSLSGQYIKSPPISQRNLIYYELDCRHPQQYAFCGPQFGNSVFECNKGKPVKGGVCCHDTIQNVCLNGPYHYNQNNLDCNTDSSLRTKLKDLLKYLLDQL